MRKRYAGSSRLGPYFLGGYCMGGTVAFEVAQQIQAQGERVALLALFDTVDWSKIPVPSIFGQELPRRRTPHVSRG